MRMHNEWAELIRSTMEDAGINNQDHIRNAQASLTRVSEATCLIRSNLGTGSGMLISADKLGFWVITCNHCVPDEETAAQTEVIFGYWETDGVIRSLPTFQVELQSMSPPWNSIQEINRHHLDYTILTLQVDEENKKFLSERAMKHQLLMNPVDSLFPVDDSLLKAMVDAPKYMPLFMFSHPRGLAKSLSAGRLCPCSLCYPKVMARQGQATHYHLNLPALKGSSGGNVLFCPLTRPTYENWWAVAMCNTANSPDCLAVAWSTILDH